MTKEIHDLSIGIERINEQIFLTLTAQGTLTHQDYEIITPMIDAALAPTSSSEKCPEVIALIDITKLKGWEIRAAWDDLKIGLKHGKEFKKIAIVGNKGWQELSASIGGWFISGEMAFYFNHQEALKWLKENEKS